MIFQLLENEGDFSQENSENASQKNASSSKEKNSENSSSQENNNENEIPLVESAASCKFACMIAEYALREQCMIFGKEAMEIRDDGSNRYTANKSVFDSLPHKFTRGDLAFAKGMPLHSSSLRSILHRWRKDRWIKQVGENAFEKK